MPKRVFLTVEAEPTSRNLRHGWMLASYLCLLLDSQPVTQRLGEIERMSPERMREAVELLAAELDHHLTTFDLIRAIQHRQSGVPGPAPLMISLTFREAPQRVRERTWDTLAVVARSMAERVSTTSYRGASAIEADERVAGMGSATVRKHRQRIGEDLKRREPSVFGLYGQRNLARWPRR